MEKILRLHLSGDADPSIQILGPMISSLHDLDEEARDWLDDDRAAQKKSDAKTPKQGDKRTRVKQTACTDMVDSANSALEQFRALHAEKLAAITEPSTPDGGTSDVKLICDESGAVAYAFKSVAGESEMMGTPKGFATAREVLMSKNVRWHQNAVWIGFPLAQGRYGESWGSIRRPDRWRKG